jgi:hypothetical protein
MEGDLFRKQSVTRPPGTSILTSLLSSPRTSSSSPDFSSPNDFFSECDLTSQSESPSPPLVRTPPRKSCLSFAAVGPKSPPKADSKNLVERKRGLKQPGPPLRETAGALNSESFHSRPVVGSIFDEFVEEKSSPIFRDSYRVGEPKKLVDDCLKKEKELRMSFMPDDDESPTQSPFRLSRSIGDEEDEGSDSAEPEEAESELDEWPLLRAKKIVPRRHWHIDVPPNSDLSLHSIDTPSRDVVDNFVAGTLDEDQHESLLEPRRSRSPHDIDPTYPSDGEEDCDEQSEISPAFATPVRFRSNSRVQPAKQQSRSPPARATKLNRANSLPWQRKRYNLEGTRPCTQPFQESRVRAIAITKCTEHKKKHHRRDKKHEELDKEEIGHGGEALAAIARRLTTKRTLALWAISI